MRTSRFKPKEVVKLLSEAAAGVPVREICVRIGISEVTFYRWKAQYEGLDAKGVRRLRQLEQENSRLRRTLSIKVLQLDVLAAELKHT
jgi:putative transposase